MIDGLTNSDVIVGAIGSAIVGVLGSLVPIFRKVADAMVGFMETKKSDSASLAVLSSAFAAAMSRSPFDRNTLLLVEDNRMDAYKFQQVCDEVLQDGQYTITITPTLSGAYGNFDKTRVIVIDVGLPDSTDVLIKRFVADIGPSIPTIVWSANEYTPEQFPGAYAITSKTDKIDRVVGIVRKALAEPRRV